MTETRQGYYHHPTVQDDHVVFICEDDLWSVSRRGGIPRRLTSNLGIVSYPRLSPDGKWLAFCGREEGQPDVYVMPAEGGEMRRLTFLGAVFKIAAWTKDGAAILFLSSHRPRIPMDQPAVYRVSLAGEYPQSFLNCPVRNVALNPKGPGIAIGRNNFDNARWKRYRGGTAGEIWIDPDFPYENFKEARSNFVKLNLPQGNPNGPLWIGERLYFASDHDGVGNLYSCTLAGDDLRRETAHRDFYVRHPSTDGRTIVYQAGADLFTLNVATREVRRLPIQWRSPRVQTQRKFSSAARYLENYHLHPKGHSIAVTARGKLFSMAHWEGAPVQYGTRESARYRLAHWLNDGKRLAAISDQNNGEEKLVLFSGEPSQEPERLIEVPPGRIQTMQPSPTAAQVALTTSRLDLWLVDLESGNRRQLDQNAFSEITGVTFSPDGRWLAYRKPLADETSAIFLCELESGAVHQITQPVLYDFYPNFDPDGRYLYFLSTRILNPVNDNVQFAVSFPAASKPYLITLRKELTNPFVPSPAAPGEESAPKLDAGKSPAGAANGKEEKTSEASNGSDKTEPKEKSAEPLRIDLDGMQNRVIEFPVKEGIHRQVLGIKDKVVFTSFPIRGRADLGDWSASEEDEEKGTLWVYDFVTQKLEAIAYDVQSMQVANGGKTLSYRHGRRLRVLKAGEKPSDNSDSATTRKSGWLDLDRAKFSIDPRPEWRQMFREAWRLQREFFWTENMSGVDWQKVFDRYYPLVERVATRAEFSDLIWEMQGELGTSHAYEAGGDYRYTPQYAIGRLGADVDYDAENKRYRFSKIYRGDVWMKDCASPLCAPGLNISEGEALLAISGVPLSATVTPGHLLANAAGQDVVLTVQSPTPGSAPRNVTVKTLRDEVKVRYREWVERNMRRVNEVSGGKIGYLHIPDMGTEGLIEFHRYYLAQTHKAGLIVDVRYNGGGNVSEILLEKLIRRPLGYDVQRWGTPQPYPHHSMSGPIIAITNEFAGSDGDIFCHSFKLLKIGPLIGKRTWGGVIGIDHRYNLVDGGRTTQPQYSFWFNDVHWRVENYGVDPDIVVDFDPNAHLRGEDPQLERALAEARRLLEEKGMQPPKFDGRPNLALPE
jgi:tricorn protease